MMNKVCILNFGRKLLSGLRDHWCVVMWDKYHRDKEKNNIVVKSTNSHLWKAIVKLWPALYKYRFFSICNGMTMRICNDVWIDKGLLIGNFKLFISTHLFGAKVAELGDEIGWCNMELLRK